MSESQSFTAMTPAEVLAKMQEQGITDLEGIVRKALQVAQEAADKEDSPAHAVALLHSHFLLYHEEGLA